MTDNAKQLIKPITEAFRMMESELELAFGETVRPSKDAEKVARWAMFFQDLTAEQIGKAALIACVNLKKFPKPVEFREIIQGKTEDRAELMFDKVRDCVSSIGTLSTWFKSDLDGDGAALFAANSIGLDVLGKATTDERAILRGQFRRIYIAAVNEGRSLDKIAGMYECQNRARGFDMTRLGLYGRSILSCPPELADLAPAAIEGSTAPGLPGPSEQVMNDATTKALPARATDGEDGDPGDIDYEQRRFGRLMRRLEEKSA